jgi:hypothetical protein
MITKKELLELLRSEEGNSEIADSILAKLNEPGDVGIAAKDVTQEGAAWPKEESTGIDFDKVGRKLKAFAERLGVKPRTPNQSSTWAIRVGRNTPSYDVLELANALLDRVEALDAKLDRKSWDMVISAGPDED